MIEQKRKIELLHVEDNEADLMIIEDAFEDCETEININAVHDGVEALEYLNRQGNFADSVRPDIILVDMNMPRMNGTEFLKRVKSDENLKDIPVIMCSSSDYENDVRDSYRNHANGYILKTCGIEKLMQTLKALEAFWFNTAIIPNYHND